MTKILLFSLIAVICFPLMCYKSYEIISQWLISYQPHFLAALLFYVFSGFFSIINVISAIRDYGLQKKHEQWIKEHGWFK